MQLLFKKEIAINTKQILIIVKGIHLSFQKTSDIICEQFISVSSRFILENWLFLHILIASSQTAKSNEKKRTYSPLSNKSLNCEFMKPKSGVNDKTWYEWVDVQIHFIKLRPKWKTNQFIWIHFHSRVSIIIFLFQNRLLIYELHIKLDSRRYLSIRVLGFMAGYLTACVCLLGLIRKSVYGAISECYNGKIQYDYLTQIIKAL